MSGGYLDLLLLLLVAGGHLLQALLQLLVPLQEALPQLGRQLQVCGTEGDMTEGDMKRGLMAGTKWAGPSEP